MKTLISICAGLGLFFSTIPMLLASEFSMQSGKWEFSHTLKMSSLPQPVVEVSSECITPEEASQDPLADFVDGGNCTISKRKVDGDRISFELECREEGIISRGKGELRGQGNTVSGFVEMTMDNPGGPMKVSTRWQGKRLGSCQ
ncbi:DUF3617 domain-containing protein [Desulfogranum mediterraneum]|uniref:DUF3617 domain-containing protein n=1 Tax=Desulfogranum mediterraneum TaxID=160661 RepID=UPI0003F6B8B9|nr:DUF3617 family protein [Desulfogranum mediterraneum]